MSLATFAFSSKNTHNWLRCCGRIRRGSEKESEWGDSFPCESFICVRKEMCLLWCFYRLLAVALYLEGSIQPSPAESSLIFPTPRDTRRRPHLLPWCHQHVTHRSEGQVLIFDTQHSLFLSMPFSFSRFIFLMKRNTTQLSLLLKSFSIRKNDILLKFVQLNATSAISFSCFETVSKTICNYFNSLFL